MELDRRQPSTVAGELYRYQIFHRNDGTTILDFVSKDGMYGFTVRAALCDFYGCTFLDLHLEGDRFNMWCHDCKREDDSKN